MSAAVAQLVGAHAAGALAGQQFIDDLRHERAVAADGWDRLKELQAKHGNDSPAAAAFVTEISKRAAQ